MLPLSNNDSNDGSELCNGHIVRHTIGCPIGHQCEVSAGAILCDVMMLTAKAHFILGVNATD